jgi:hypothetical protein
MPYITIVTYKVCAEVEEGVRVGFFKKEKRT